MLSTATPWVALAAPTPTPPATPSSTPAPQRAPAVVSAAASPGVAASPVASPPATPQPTSTPVVNPTQGTDLATPVALATEVTDIEEGVDWHAFIPTDQADHLATMDRAARESNCGVPWQLLAAIARVESDFGRNMSSSTAGAIGYGQFLPSSWQTFGSEGNAYDYRDALPAIALYLCQAGLERDPRTALFAYNHADWYVDLVLDLAVQYDRMAPGAPIPAVLNVGPAQKQPTSMAYASGRDLRLENRLRALDGPVKWLGVPWRGRSPGQPIAPSTLEGAALAMLRLNFGLRGDVPTPKVASGSDDLAALASAAWDNGLLAAPKLGQGQAWTIADVRLALARGRPVVVYVGSSALPGHPGDADDGEQPLVLIGTTPTGFVYSDPSFSSSLGYGLEMSDADLQRFWDAAARPRQALAFMLRPQAPPRQAHVSQAEPPEPVARVEPTPTPLPLPTATATLVPTPLPAPTVEPTSTVTPLPLASAEQPPPPDHKGELTLAAAAATLGGALILRWLLGRASS